jgi:flavin-dependent dehydrogenase
MSEQAQVIIAGAGIAGLSLAGLLGREGISVLLIDRAALPRDRVCGEGIMPLGMGVLRELGIEPGSLPGQDFSGLEFHTAGQRHAIGFGGERGRGIRRTHLVRALAEVAARSNVREVRDQVLAPVLERGRVRALRGGRGVYEGEIVIAADGAHSPLMRGLGVRFAERGERMSLRMHFELARPHGLERVQIGLFPPHDVYVTPVSEREILATTMCDRDGYRRIVRNYPAFLRACPLGGLFAGAEANSVLLGWRQPLVRPERFAASGVLAVGDAGGGIDPCLGMGMSLALASAREAARTVKAMLGNGAPREAEEQRFHLGRDAMYRHYSAFDSLFRMLVTSRAGSGILVWGMRHWPQAAEVTARIVSQYQPWRSFPWSALLKPALHRRQV